MQLQTGSAASYTNLNVTTYLNLLTTVLCRIQGLTTSKPPEPILTLSINIHDTSHGSMYALHSATATGTQDTLGYTPHLHTSLAAAAAGVLREGALYRGVSLT